MEKRKVVWRRPSDISKEERERVLERFSELYSKLLGERDGRYSSFKITISFDADELRRYSILRPNVSCGVHKYDLFGIKRTQMVYEMDTRAQILSAKVIHYV